jgi:hypothetical protein
MMIFLTSLPLPSKGPLTTQPLSHGSLLHVLRSINLYSMLFGTPPIFASNSTLQEIFDSGSALQEILDSDSTLQEFLASNSTLQEILAAHPILVPALLRDFNGPRARSIILQLPEHQDIWHIGFAATGPPDIRTSLTFPDAFEIIPSSSPDPKPPPEPPPSRAM